MPEWFSQFAELQVLILHDNQLTEILASIGRLAGLQELILSSNQLAALPASIGRLAGLRVLNVANNQMAVLPEELRRLERLEALYLHDNPVAVGLPAEVLGPTWQQVLAIRRPLPSRSRSSTTTSAPGGSPPAQRGQADPVRAVGRGQDVPGEPPGPRTFEPQPMTEGIRITQWLVQLHGDEEVRLHVWDFGGQEIMHATHRFFLTERSLYLLVLNGREGTEDLDAEYWLE